MCWLNPRPPTHTHTHTPASPFSSSDLEEASNPKVTPRRSVHILGPAAAGWRLEAGESRRGRVLLLSTCLECGARSVCLSVCLSVSVRREKERERMNG